MQNFLVINTIGYHCALFKTMALVTIMPYLKQYHWLPFCLI